MRLGRSYQQPNRPQVGSCAWSEFASACRSLANPSVVWDMWDMWSQKRRQRGTANLRWTSCETQRGASRVETTESDGAVVEGKNSGAEQNRRTPEQPTYLTTTDSSQSGTLSTAPDCTPTTRPPPLGSCFSEALSAVSPPVSSGLREWEGILELHHPDGSFRRCGRLRDLPFTVLPRSFTLLLHSIHSPSTHQPSPTLKHPQSRPMPPQNTH